MLKNNFHKDITFSMKIHALVLFFALLLLQSCSRSSYYTISTDHSFESNYQILKVEDSGIVAIPDEFSHELTPEIIREYSMVIDYDSIKSLRKIPRSSSITGVIGTSSLFGFGAAGLLGIAATANQSGYVRISPAASFIGFGLLFGLPLGLITGFSAAPKEMVIVSNQTHYTGRKDLYIRYELDEILDK